MKAKDHILFRMAVMLACLGINAYTLSRFAALIQPFLSIPYDWKVELAIVTGQLVFQFPFIYLKPAVLKMVYYENMLMFSLIGSVLLMPLLFVNNICPLVPLVNLLYFALVVGILFLEHYRRVRRLNLPAYLCWTWVLYRFIVLLIII